MEPGSKRGRKSGNVSAIESRSRQGVWMKAEGVSLSENEIMREKVGTTRQFLPQYSYKNNKVIHALTGLPRDKKVA
jgi:hypothetical protein